MRPGRLPVAVIAAGMSKAINDARRKGIANSDKNDRRRRAYRRERDWCPDGDQDMRFGANGLFHPRQEMNRQPDPNEEDRRAARR